LAALGLILYRRNPQIVFFGLITLIGALLTKQEAEPLSHLYLWLYSHVPGFNAFREASKFYFLIVLGYSVLIGALVKGIGEIKRSKKVWTVGKVIIVLGITGLFLWNTKPFITGEIGTIFVPREIPNDYLITKDFILNQPDYFRTYWIPISSRWSIYTNQHPKVNGIDIVNGDWANLAMNSASKSPTNQQIVSILKQPYAKNLLDRASIKYIFVPLRDEANNDDFFVFYGDDRQFYVDTLNSLPFLKRIDIGTKNLAVYENTDFKPYIFSPTNLYQLPSTQNLPQTYSFVTSEFAEKDFNFISSDTNKSVPTTSVTDAFSNLGLRDFQPGLITKNFSLNNPILYTNTNQPALSYQVTKGTLTITSDNKNLVTINSQPITKLGDTKTTVLSKKLTPQKTYLLGVGQTPIAIDTSGATKSLGAVPNNTGLLSVDKLNLIPNHSFEQGLWQQEVLDCNNYDSRALINMKIDNQDSTDGNNSLRLDADQHTACSGPNPISVKGGDSYLISFDYEIKNTKEIAYELDFDNSKKTVLKEHVNAPSDDWRTLQRIINVPSDATHMSLLVYGIPDESRQNHAVTHYDNFHLNHLNFESTLNFNSNPTFSKQLLSNNSQTLSYTDPSYDYHNLITNPSLEQGLWKKTVGDCNAYDNSPIIGMKIDTQNSTEGKNSLQLEAKRHNACTGPSPVSVKENQDYRLSFDYQSPNSAGASYNISFDDPSHATVSENLPIKDSAWHTATKYFRVPPGTSHLTLTVYSYADAYGSINVITRYDNFSLIEIPNIQSRYFLVNHPTQTLQPPARITYDSINPSLKYVHVTSAKTPFYLAMSESYQDGWRLELNNSQVNGRLHGWIPWVHPNAVEDSAHVKLNDFENGWYVDPVKLCQDNRQGCVQNSDGSYNLEMQIEFVPQRWFYLGTLISATTLISCFIYLTALFLKKIFRKRPKPVKKREDSKELSNYWTTLHTSKQ
jgi:hypothetical protein